MRSTEDLPFEILPTFVGDAALALVEYEGPRESRDPGEIAIYFGIRREPKTRCSRIGVTLERIDYDDLRERGRTAGKEQHQLLREFGALAIALHLDTLGMPPFTPSGTNAFHIDGEDLAAIYWNSSRHGNQPSDENILHYCIRKIYWGWRHGLMGVSFSSVDARRIGVPANEIDRVAIAGEGKYWTTQQGGQLAYRPTGRLIQEYSSGVVPGAAQPPLIVVSHGLAAPRYKAAKLHLDKAINFSTGDNPDLHNAVKEAVSAVESLALVVLGKGKGTLGDCLKDLKARDLVASSLLKTLEGLWGYSSEAPGIRHGKPQMNHLSEAEANFALAVAANALGLLLQLDVARGSRLTNV
jgi:hypothetical protein